MLKLLVTMDANGDMEETLLKVTPLIMDQLHCSQLSSATQLMYLNLLLTLCGPHVLLQLIQLTALSLTVASGLKVKN